MLNCAKSSTTDFEPRAVFRTLYQPHCLQALCLRALEMPQIPESHEDQCTRIENNIVTLFSVLQHKPCSSAELRSSHLKSQSAQWCHLKSNRTCLLCVCRSPEHPRDCGHAICDICPQTFGESFLHMEYHFTLSQCFLCLSQVSLTAQIKSPTAGPCILSIDSGGSKGVISLEFIRLLQEALGRGCRLQDVIDLAVGTSSGE